MAILQPASREAGTKIEAVPPVPSTTEVGTELEAARPAGVRLGEDTGGVAGIGLDGPMGVLLPVPGAETAGDVADSSAAHLVGTSAAEIHTVDVKFARLLATVHETRPGDDLEIIRKAWAVCLQPHEGQERASRE